MIVREWLDRFFASYYVRRLQREIMADVAPLVGMGMIVGLLFGAAAARGIPVPPP